MIPSTEGVLETSLQPGRFRIASIDRDVTSGDGLAVRDPALGWSLGHVEYDHFRKAYFFTGQLSIGSAGEFVTLATIADARLSVRLR